MAVPARGNNTRSVAREGAQAAVGPRHPGRFDLYAWEIFDHGAVLGSVSRLPKRADMPRAGDHGNLSIKFFQRSPNVGTHEGFAVEAALYFFWRLRRGVFLCAGLGKRGLDRSEDGECFLPVRAMLFDQAVPEGFAIFVACRVCEEVKRIDACRRRIALRKLLRSLFQPERYGGGPIEELHRTFAFQRPIHGLPFRRKLGEWHEGGKTRLIGGVQQNGDGRLQVGVSNVLDYFVALGGTFDEDGGWVEHIQRFAQQCRRSRTMMADPQDVEPFVGLRRHPYYMTSRMAE